MNYFGIQYDYIKVFCSDFYKNIFKTNSLLEKTLIAYEQ